MPFECLHFHNLPKKHDKNLNSTIIITFCGNTFALGKFNLLRLDCCVAFQAKLLVETEQPVGFYLYIIRPQLTSRTSTHLEPRRVGCSLTVFFFHSFSRSQTQVSQACASQPSSSKATDNVSQLASQQANRDMEDSSVRCIDQTNRALVAKLTLACNIHGILENIFFAMETAVIIDEISCKSHFHSFTQ